MELLRCREARTSFSSFSWCTGNNLECPLLAYDEAYRGWSDILRTLCRNVVSYLHMPLKKHSFCLDLTVFGLPVRIRMQSDAVKTAGILCMIGIGIGIGLTSWLVCKLHGHSSRSHGRALHRSRDRRLWDFDRTPRPRSSVTCLGVISSNDFPSDCVWTGLPRRRWPVTLETSKADDDNQTSLSACSGCNLSPPREAISRGTGIQWRGDESFASHPGGCGRQGWQAVCNATGVDDACGQQPVHDLPPDDFSDKGLPWPRLSAASQSDVPSMQSSARDSGFLEWVPTDVQQPWADEASVCAMASSNVGSQQGHLCAGDGRWSVAAAGRGLQATTGAAAQRQRKDSLPQPELQTWRSSGEAAPQLADCELLYDQWSVAAWVASHRTLAEHGCDVGLAADCGVAEVDGERHREATPKSSSSTKIETLDDSAAQQDSQPNLAAAAVSRSCSSLKAYSSDSGRCSRRTEKGKNRCVLERSVFRSPVSVVSIDLPGSVPAWSSPLTDVGSEGLANAGHAYSQFVCGGECLSVPGGARCDQCNSASVARQDSVDRTWSAVSDAASDLWHDTDSESWCASASSLTSPQHASVSPQQATSSTCGSQVSSSQSSVDFDGARLCPDAGALERLAALETEVSTLKAEVIDIEQCLKGLVARDTFDSGYSPERIQKLSRVVLNSQHVAGVTSTEIRRAFDILRKYRWGGGGGGTSHREEGLPPLSRGSSWPDESGCSYERRNSFSDLTCRDRSLAPGASDICDKGVSSDDEFVTRKSFGGRRPCASARKPAAHPQRSYRGRSISLSNVAAGCSGHADSASAASCVGADYGDAERTSRLGHLADRVSCSTPRIRPAPPAVEPQDAASADSPALLCALKAVDIADYQSGLCVSDERSELMMKGYARLKQELGFSRVCHISQNVRCCALRAALVGALLSKLPLTQRLSQAVETVKVDVCLLTQCSDSNFLGSHIQQACIDVLGRPMEERNIALHLESVMAVADGEVKVMEKHISRCASGTLLQDDVKVLSDLISSLFDDAGSGSVSVLPTAVDVAMALHAYQLPLEQQQLLSTDRSAERWLNVDVPGEVPDASSSTHLFWRRLLLWQRRGHDPQLEQVDLCLLAGALGFAVMLIRPARHGQPDFTMRVPSTGATASRAVPSLPVVAIITEDDRRYSVALP